MDIWLFYNLDLQPSELLSELHMFLKSITIIILFITKNKTKQFVQYQQNIN